MEEIIDEPINEPTGEIVTVAQSFLQTLLDLPSETSDKDEINFDLVENFCKEIDSVTTLKRLSLIPDIDKKFERAFVILQRHYHYNLDFNFFVKTLREISTDTEKDYFTIMLQEDSCKEENNV